MACLAVALFAAGVGCCAMANARAARLVARIALLSCLVAGGVLAAWPQAVAEPADSPALLRCVPGMPGCLRVTLARAYQVSAWSQA